MGERSGTRASRRALRLTLAAIVVAAIPGVIANPAHAVLACNPSPCLTATADEYTLTFTTAGTDVNVTAAQGLLANDFGPAYPTTTVNLGASDVDSAAGAKVFVHADGSFTYRPLDPDVEPYTGIDSFDYWIKDKSGNEDTATATITINPVLHTDTYFMQKGGTLTVAAADGVFANDIGLDRTSARWDSDNTTSANGAVAVEDNGAFSYTPPTPTYEGTDWFGYTAIDIDGDNTFSAIAFIHVDSTPPAVSVTAPTSVVSLTSAVPVKWSATDPAGIKNYDVQVRHAAWNGALSAWSTWKTATTATTANYPGNLGVDYCFRIRATDHSQNVSGWSAQRCTAVAFKATGLGYSTGWLTKSRADVFGGVIKYTSTKGKYARRTSLRAKQVWIVATKCATCGTLQAKFNGVVTANVNLASPTTLRKQLIRVGSFSRISSGTLTLTVTSATGKTVTLEGMAAYSE